MLLQELSNHVRTGVNAEGAAPQWVEFGHEQTNKVDTSKKTLKVTDTKEDTNSDFSQSRKAALEEAMQEKLKITKTFIHQNVEKNPSSGSTSGNVASTTTNVPSTTTTTATTGVNATGGGGGGGNNAYQDNASTGSYGGRSSQSAPQKSIFIFFLQFPQQFKLIYYLNLII